MEGSPTFDDRFRQAGSVREPRPPGGASTGRSGRGRAWSFVARTAGIAGLLTAQQASSLPYANRIVFGDRVVDHGPTQSVAVGSGYPDPAPALLGRQASLDLNTTIRAVPTSNAIIIDTIAWSDRMLVSPTLSGLQAGLDTSISCQLAGAVPPADVPSCDGSACIDTVHPTMGPQAVRAGGRDDRSRAERHEPAAGRARCPRFESAAT